MADVLLYNALNDDNNEYQKRLSDYDACIAQRQQEIADVNAISEQALAELATGGNTNFSLWCLIPEQPADGSTFTSGFKVCDTSGYYRCGAACSWVVPAGASCARFQLWGAGAPTGSACCCGFSPIGGSGAYASVIIPVTPGNTYTLCAGCAYCCYAQRAQSDADGCSSYVQGAGLSNFCAEGGEGGIWCEAKTRGSYGANSGYCMYLGACICNNETDTCYGGNLTCSMGCTSENGSNKYGFWRSCKTYYGTATSGKVYGINGMFSAISIGHCVCTWLWSAPVYGFPTTSCCFELFTASCGGCYRSAINGYRQIPGAGGWGSMMKGGTTQYDGDAGRMGMVCVSYK